MNRVGTFDHDNSLEICDDIQLGLSLKTISLNSNRMKALLNQNYSDGTYLAGVWALIAITIVVVIGISISKYII